MRNILIPLLLSVSAFGLAVGFFLSVRPANAIEWQRKFYEAINWRIEPVSMQKELRNTRWMGWFLLVFIAVALCYARLKSYFTAF